MAAMHLGPSRFLYDQGKQRADAKLRGQASAPGDASRVNTGAAYELQTREAMASKNDDGLPSPEPTARPKRRRNAAAKLHARGEEPR
jgi:hypothetical protein